jgi:hypothetical protein
LIKGLGAEILALKIDENSEKSGGNLIFGCCVDFDQFLA